MVQFFIIRFKLCWLAVSVRNRNPFLVVCFQDPRSKVLGGGGGGGWDPFMQSTAKVQRVTIARGEFSLTLDHG